MSNLLDKASIILTPTAYNNGTTLCVKPSDGTGDFDFSRATEATRVNSQGLVETIGINLPRINYEGFSYDGSGNVVLDSGCGSWLWEPQSTNLVTYSEDFSQASWLNVGSLAITSNYGISPDGTLNSTRVQFAGSSNSLYDTIPHAIGDTSSIYVKGVSGETLQFGAGANVAAGQLFTLNGDWQRLDFNSTGSAIFCVGTFLSATARDIEVWGAQLEQQSYATSYIPTNGEANGVTRNQDVCTNGGSLASINSTEGVLYAEIAALVKINPSGNITLTDGTGNNRIYIYYLIDNSISVIYNVNSTGASINNFSLANITDQTKIAVRWGNSNVSVWINGTSVLSNTTSNFLPNTLNVLSFDKPSGGVPFEGKTKCIAVWKEALSDEELTELTTI